MTGLSHEESFQRKGQRKTPSNSIYSGIYKVLLGFDGDGLKTLANAQKIDTTLVQIPPPYFLFFNKHRHNKMMKTFIKIFITLGFLQPHFTRAEILNKNADASTEILYFYQNRYLLKNPYDKLIDNHGDGFESLYGLRNFRAVLNGVVYRGGANNAFNKHKKRDNKNPLPNEGLAHLCQEGFSTAIYLYPTHYQTAPKITNCKSILHQDQTLNYLQESPQMSEQASDKVLNLIYKRLTSPTDHAPIYLHCWNGWHASGLISAYVLRQFCGYSAEQAINYWNRNTDGVNQGPAYDRLRSQIRAFKPHSDMIIDKNLKEKICPQAS
ncbi:MAG: hypothetical protein ACXVB4_15465 [Pseudobdellovibrionaceae bacterium]